MGYDLCDLAVEAQPEVTPGNVLQAIHLSEVPSGLQHVCATARPYSLPCHTVLLFIALLFCILLCTAAACPALHQNVQYAWLPSMRHAVLH